MADIDLVIKIDEDYYENIKYNVENGSEYMPWTLIAHGTPLPKGHGRLIDADAFQLFCFRKNFDMRLSAGGLATINMYLENSAPTIIEADKAEREEI